MMELYAIRENCSPQLQEILEFVRTQDCLILEVLVNAYFTIITA